MAATRYTKMAYSSADEMVFGTAKQPVSYGFGIKVGAGRVIPELNYGPRPGKEKDPETLRKEYVDYISKDAFNRAVTIGLPDLQLETEWVSQMGNPKMATPVVEGQKAICEKYHEEYGINCAVRQTIPDQREAEEGYRPGMGGKHAYPEALFQCAEIACENGADVLSCETLGGKELAPSPTETSPPSCSESDTSDPSTWSTSGPSSSTSPRRTRSSLEETRTAPEPTPLCSWLEDTSTTMSRGPSLPSPGLSPLPGLSLLGSAAPPDPTRTADTRDPS